jgi:NarL family two-component system response regulator LiaR
MYRIRVVIVEDEPDWLELMADFLGKEEDISIVGTARAKDDAIAMAKVLEPDVILMDINLSGNKLDGIFAASEICRFSSSKIIMLTSMEGEDIVINSFTAGAVDFISKPRYREIPGKIRSSYYTNSPYEILLKDYKRLKEEKQLGGLTDAEREVFRLLEEGQSQAEMAKNLYITENTLKKHVNKIIKKLGVSSSKEAVKKVRMRGLWHKN